MGAAKHLPGKKEAVMVLNKDFFMVPEEVFRVGNADTRACIS